MQFVKYLRLILARSIARSGSRIMQDRITLDYSLLVSVFKNCSACAFCPHKQLPCWVYLIYWGSQTDSIKLDSGLLTSGILFENIKFLITSFNSMSSRILHLFLSICIDPFMWRILFAFLFLSFLLVCVCACVCVCVCVGGCGGGGTFLGRRINWGGGLAGA